MQRDEEHVVFDETSKLAAFERASTLFNPDWLDDAACTELEIDDFFLPDGVAQVPRIEVAMTCLSCPVRMQCLLTAAEMEKGRAPYEAKGIFGGLSPKARNRLFAQHPSTWAESSIKMLSDYLDMKIKGVRGVPAKSKRALLEQKRLLLEQMKGR